MTRLRDRQGPGPWALRRAGGALQTLPKDRDLSAKEGDF